ncbi:hypothetical protein [Seohaeicola sp.]|uniref:hypothetical protein n=1 Tax=Seohaeicola sp. TaxID=2042026 RepID=UPI003A8AF4A1
MEVQKAVPQELCKNKKKSGHEPQVIAHIDSRFDHSCKACVSLRRGRLGVSWSCRIMSGPRRLQRGAAAAPPCQMHFGKMAMVVTA